MMEVYMQVGLLEKQMADRFYQVTITMDGAPCFRCSLVFSRWGGQSNVANRIAPVIMLNET